MSRIPPNLLYLTIYNPTLRPVGPVSDDDEDAEEQAHILFYTSKERAVSRDRMLRQVGLAKALVNFSDMFSGVDICNNVHSQTKRLIMVSPEPNFWIHASVELAKVPRAPPEKGKAKAKAKVKSKFIEKGKEKNPENTLLYDYQEGSVHDLALRADILRGYEQFKLTHGSFTTILSTIGQEGLELQLERFFTVWAWSWDLEERVDFGEHLGIPLHPSYRSLGPTINDYSQQLPDRVSSILIQPPYVVPSSQYISANYPTSLPRHLLSLIPSKPPTPETISRDTTVKGRRPLDGDAPNDKDPPRETSTGTFLGMNMNVKWGWPVALTFGKGPGKRLGLEESKQGLEESKQGLEESKEAPTVEESGPSDMLIPSTVTQGLYHGALVDAVSDNMSGDVSASSSTEGLSIPPLGHLKSRPSTPSLSDASEKVEDDDASCVHHERSPVDVDSRSITSAAEPTVYPRPPPVFSSISTHLASDKPHLTTHQKIYYIINDRSLLALIGLDEELTTILPELAQNTLTLLQNIETLLSEELSKTLTPDQLPTVSRILQPTDIHIMSTGRQFTIPSPNFTSKSSYLYDAEELQTLDPDISEVFSRGLNPQHWHIARRVLGPSSTEEYDVTSREEVYMQIFRKEASLSDVDNVLAGVIRRGGFIDGSG